MRKKQFFIFGFVIAAFLVAGVSIFAAPLYEVQRSLMPATDNLYFIGSTSPAFRWGGLYVGNAASSTILGNLGVGTTTAGTVLSIQGVGNFNAGTSTLYTSLRVPTLTATSGIEITGGCYKLPDGTCLAGGGVTGTGSAGRVAFWNGASSITSNSIFVFDTTQGRFGVGTSTVTAAGPALSVSGDGLLSGGNLKVLGTIFSNNFIGTTTSIATGIGTTSPGNLFSVHGEGLFAGAVRAPFFVATSSSLFQGGVTITCTDCITDANVVNTATLDNLTQITTRSILDTTGTLTVARGGTSRTSLTSSLLVGAGTGEVIGTSSPTVGYITASSTVTASDFISASTTNFTVRNIEQIQGTGTSTNSGGQSITSHLRVNSIEITDHCQGCPAAGGLPAGGTVNQVVTNTSAGAGNWQDPSVGVLYGCKRADGTSGECVITTTAATTTMALTAVPVRSWYQLIFIWTGKVSTGAWWFRFASSSAGTDYNERREENDSAETTATNGSACQPASALSVAANGIAIAHINGSSTPFQIMTDLTQGAADAAPDHIRHSCTFEPSSLGGHFTVQTSSGNQFGASTTMYIMGVRNLNP